MKCLKCNEEMARACDEKGCGWVCEKCGCDSRETKQTINYGNLKKVIEEIFKTISGGGAKK